MLCHREQRYVGAQLTFHYDRKQIVLEQTELSKGLAGKYVELYDFADRPLEVRWNSKLLPYRVFSKDQRVTHTAIVENKRLGHALAIVKAEQDIRREPKVMTNSAKGGYQKRPRQLYGPDYKEKSPPHDNDRSTMTYSLCSQGDIIVLFQHDTIGTIDQRRTVHSSVPQEDKSGC